MKKYILPTTAAIVVIALSIFFYYLIFVRFSWHLSDDGTLTLSGKEMPDNKFITASQWKTIKKVVIKEGLTNIGNRAFSGCTSLTSITIPEAVKSIGNHVFNNCPSLKSITCKAKTPPTLGFVCIDYKKAYIPLLVPANSIDAYKNNKEWAQFKNIQSM